MLFVGIDLHKKTITVCVVNQARETLLQKRFLCCERKKIRDFFAALGPFQAVVEATASYEWLWELLEPLADRLVLAHPKKLRIIAESTRKSDKLDARVLAEFLALDMIPQAYMAQVALSAADRFVLGQLQEHWQHLEKQRRAADQTLRAFAKKAPVAEAEARAALATIPEVGPVTINVVVSEVGDVRRFRSAKQVTAYAGLAPGRRESAGKSKDLGITKEGSRRLRWALVEASWRIVRRSPRWQAIYEQLSRRRGKKKAVVAVARRLLTVMVALLRSGQSYCMVQPAPSTAAPSTAVALAAQG